jgi:hypothetical protein
MVSMAVPLGRARLVGARRLDDRIDLLGLAARGERGLCVGLPVLMGPLGYARSVRRRRNVLLVAEAARRVGEHVVAVFGKPVAVLVPLVCVVRLVVDRFPLVLRVAEAVQISGCFFAPWSFRGFVTSTSSGEPSKLGTSPEQTS